MGKLLQKPYLIFWLSIPIITSIGMTSRYSVFSIDLYDTYFVASYMDLALLVSALCGFIGLGYWLVQRAGITLSKRLIRTHILLSVGGGVGIVISTCLPLGSDANSAFPLFEGKARQDFIFILLAILIALGQLAYGVNMFFGIFRKTKTGDR